MTDFRVEFVPIWVLPLQAAESGFGLMIAERDRLGSGNIQMKEHKHQIRMTAEEVTVFLEKAFPQIDAGGRVIFIEDVVPMGARVRMAYHERLLRPGGTISGPSMFMLADVGVYAALLGMIGPVPLAVTTNLNINFLRKPAQRDMLADVRILKIGRRLAVAEASLTSEGEDAVVAHATTTYSIPPSADTVK